MNTIHLDKLETIEPNGSVWSWTYDSLGRMIEQKDPEGNTN